MNSSVMELLHNWNPSKFVAKACNIIIFANLNRPSAIKWNLYGILQSRSCTSTYFRHEKSIFGLWIWARLITRLKLYNPSVLKLCNGFIPPKQNFVDFVVAFRAPIGAMVSSHCPQITAWALGSNCPTFRHWLKFLSNVIGKNGPMYTA